MEITDKHSLLNKKNSVEAHVGLTTSELYTGLWTLRNFYTTTDRQEQIHGINTTSPSPDPAGTVYKFVGFGQPAGTSDPWQFYPATKDGTASVQQGNSWDYMLPLNIWAKAHGHQDDDVDDYYYVIIASDVDPTTDKSMTKVPIDPHYCQKIDNYLVVRTNDTTILSASGRGINGPVILYPAHSRTYIFLRIDKTDYNPIHDNVDPSGLWSIKPNIHAIPWKVYNSFLQMRKLETLDMIDEFDDTNGTDEFEQLQETSGLAPVANEAKADQIPIALCSLPAKSQAFSTAKVNLYGEEEAANTKVIPSSTTQQPGGEVVLPGKEVKGMFKSTKNWRNESLIGHFGLKSKWFFTIANSKKMKRLSMYYKKLEIRMNQEGEITEEQLEDLEMENAGYQAMYIRKRFTDEQLLKLYEEEVITRDEADEIMLIDEDLNFWF